MKRKWNNQQFLQYQQCDQSLVTSSHWTRKWRYTAHRNVANGVKAVVCIICPHKELSMNSEFISLQGN